jgi:hypothetical protein
VEYVTGLLCGVDPEVGHVLLGVPLSSTSNPSSLSLLLLTSHSIVEITPSSQPLMTNGTTSTLPNFTDPLHLLINSSIEDGEITFST